MSGLGSGLRAVDSWSRYESDLSVSLLRATGGFDEEEAHHNDWTDGLALCCTCLYEQRERK
jgi:hypothetical protein